MSLHCEQFCQHVDYCKEQAHQWSGDGQTWSSECVLYRTMTGTYDGMVDATTGTSVLSIDGDLISRTQVYRYASWQVFCEEDVLGEIYDIQNESCAVEKLI